MREGLKIFNKKLDSSIFPLPFSFGINVAIQEHNSSPPEILRMGTMSRYEFPFKGYILGLIDFFSVFTSQVNSELVICGFGESRQQIIDKIDSMPIAVKNKIKLLDTVQYSQLNEFFNQLDVFFGMGTTLIDATKYNVIAIPVVPHTYDFISDGFFSSHPDVLLADKEKAVDINTLLLEVKGYSDQEYLDHAKLQYDLVKEIYDINRFMEFVIGKE